MRSNWSIAELVAMCVTGVFFVSIQREGIYRKQCLGSELVLIIVGVYWHKVC